MKLSALDVQLLQALRERPVTNAAFLAALTGHTQTGVARVLRRLKQNHLVRIRYNPECVYDLTSDGYSICEQLETH